MFNYKSLLRTGIPALAFLIIHQCIYSRQETGNNIPAGDLSEIEYQKDTVSAQKDTIKLQRQEILKQKYLLDSLGNAVLEMEKILEEKQKVLDYQAAQIRKQQNEISYQKNLISGQQIEVRIRRDTLDNQKAQIKDQLVRIKDQFYLISEQEKKIILQLETIEKQKIILWTVMIALFLTGFLGYSFYRTKKTKKASDKALEEKTLTIAVQRDELARQREMVSVQKDRINCQNKYIADSIEYARKIQRALLPSPELFSNRMEHFVLYKPLETVGGDFYWVSSKDDKQVIVAADCTGHGIPGAFMSMFGLVSLNEIVYGENVIMPDEIITKLQQKVMRSLNRDADEGTIKDSLDISVCTVDFDQNLLWYAGANCPLYFIRGNELRHYRADRMPASVNCRMKPFTLHKIELQKGDAFYIFSDGYADQFGGPRKKKFMTSRLKETIMSVTGMPMLRQGEKLNEIFENWRNSEPRVDDVTLLGARY